jgi:PEP-CTERM motif
MGDSDMKAAFLLIVLALALPLTAFADGIVLTNQNGSIAISNAGISSIGSQLRSFNGIVAPPGHSLGSVSFSTGALISGSIATGGTFSSTGSSFVVIGKGNYGQPKGTIFSGSFVGPIIWTLTSPPGAKNLTFTLSGTIQGMLYNGRMVSGTTVQNIYTINGQLAQGIGHIKVGSTPLSVPEPGTLSMFGVGLVALGGMVRRKLIG